jgi:WD40 repeat protein
MPGALRTAFSPDGKRLAIAGLDTDVGVVMDVQSGKEIFSEEHEDHVQNMDWSPMAGGSPPRASTRPSASGTPGPATSVSACSTTARWVMPTGAPMVAAS